jgi:hypothetical protein
MDGTVWDVPATKDNEEAFGYAGAAGEGEGSGYPKVRVITMSKCARTRWWPRRWVRWQAWQWRGESGPVVVGAVGA